MITRPSITFALVAVSAALPAAVQPRSASGAEAVSLVTRDGVQLKATYFAAAARPGSAEAKQATPVVLLHDYKETRAIFNTLVQRLLAPAAEAGTAKVFAAMTVDLRGHGESTKQVYPTGETIELDPTKFRRDDYLAMVVMDMAAVRSYLVDKNDAGELNLNKLCLVGSGMGASVAANWALQDWNWPPLAIGKQGQDVKGLVLLSPRWSLNGLSFQLPLRDRRFKENVAWMLAFGAEDTRVAADARRIVKQLERFHPKPEGGARAQATSSLQVVEFKSKLQGSTLLRQTGGQIEEQIAGFLTEHVAAKQHPWSNRRARLPE
jgi:pimeloyl-ACP methyl ester carboxylesterase